MIQNLIKQAFLDGYAKGEKCDWVKPQTAKENMANGYAVEVVNKNDLLQNVSQQREVLRAYEDFKQQPHHDGAFNADEFIEMFLAINGA